ncbi:MAG TPA: PAS domain-containing protein [Candidatus Limnocylindrales bacterium]
MAPGLRLFPNDDQDFAAFARALLAGLDAARAATAPALQAALRTRYPAAVVAAQEELARHGDTPLVWYVYRAGSIGSSRAHEWEAWAILDDERHFLEVSPALAGIAEVAADDMLGHPLEDFTNPADPSIRDDIANLWVDFLQRGSIGSSIRFNFADGRHRELEYNLEVAADGAGRHRLSVRELRR